MADKKTKRYNMVKLTMIIGLPVFIIILLLDLQGLFIKLEELIYNFKMVNRTIVPISKDIVTIDIDEASITNFGRWPWNWDKHSFIIDLCKIYNARMLGFMDINFEKENEFSFNSLEEANAIKMQIEHAIKINPLNINSILNYIVDPNEMFYDSMKTYPNIFICNTFHIPEQDISYEDAIELTKEYNLKHNENKKDAINKMNKFILCDNPIRAFKTALEITPPLKRITELAAGVGFNRLFLDDDGIVRKYLMAVNYNEKVYPSTVLQMAAEYYGCPKNKIKIFPGKYIELSEFDKSKFHFKKSIKIPIDNNGFMLVNWVGKYGNSFAHYPFDFIALHYSYIICKKALKNYQFDKTSPDIIQQQLTKSLTQSGLLTADKAEILTQIFLFSFYIEGFILNNYSYSDFTAAMGLQEDQSSKELWNQIYFNNKTANLLSQNLNTSYEEALKISGLNDNEFYKHCYKHTKYFVETKKIDDMRPLIYPELSNISIKNSYIQSSLLDFKDKIVFLGLTATGLNSNNPTPYEDRYVMLGLPPTVLNSIVTQNYIKPAPAFLNYIILFIYTIITIYIILRFTALISNILFLLLVVWDVFITYYLFLKYNIDIKLVSPIILLIICYFTTVLYKFFDEQKERKKIRGMFSTMVSPEVLKMLERNPDKFKLAGEKKEATLFSSDVSGFTTISEGVTARELAEILNIYLTPMSNIIMSYNGYCDKYEGDAIKADFGVPLLDEEHSWKACYASLMQQEELKVIQRMILIKYGVSISARMGVNTGIVSAGNMGSDKKMQYTVMGEAVALAEELEPINKLFESWIAIGPTTYQKAKEKIETRLLNYLIMGNEETIPVYELMGWNKEFFLKYWSGKPIPTLIINGYKKMTPEKILAYHYYYNSKNLAESSMLKYIKKFFGDIKPKCIDYLKVNDIISVIELKTNLKKLEEEILNFKDKINEKELDKSYMKDYETLLKKSNESAAAWEKIIFQWKSKIKLLFVYQQYLQSIIEKSISDKFFNEIDVLDKRVECLNKRIRFPKETDLVGKELADNLITLVQTENNDKNAVEVEQTLKNLHTEISNAKNEFINYLNSNAEDYHKMIADYCTISETQIKVRDIYYKAREEYLKKNWDASISLFEEALKILPTDGPSQKYIKRIQDYKKNPPAENWNGAWLGEV